jgi:hypothetical protein
MFIAFDLEQFAQSVAAEPTVEDRSTLSRIFTSFESLPKDSKLSAVEKSLAGVIKGNSYERRELLAVLGYAGVLQPTSRSGFFESFTDWADREARPLNKDDWPYPIRWWTPKDGVDRRAREFWFPTAAASGSNR